jgi:hypothetical protein
MFDENPLGGILNGASQDLKLQFAGILGPGAYDLSIDALKVINGLFPQPPSRFVLSDSSGNSTVTHPPLLLNLRRRGHGLRRYD